MNLYIIPAWYPSNESDLAGSFVREQARALAERGHRVTVIRIEPVSVSTLFSKPWHETREWQDDAVRTLFHKVIVPVPGKLSGWQDSYISNLYLKIIKKQIKADQAAGFPTPDLIHAHVSHSCAYYCLKAAKVLSLPLVVTEHYSGLLLGTASEKDYRHVKQTIEQSDAFIYVGSRFQRALDDRLRVQKQTYVIPNMLDTDLYHVSESRAASPFTFLTACHLKANKSIDLLIKAFHAAFEKDCNVRLTIAGDGDELIRLKQLAADLEETDRISFFGRYSREQATTLFSEADAFVLTSKVETFGIVYVEALASGVPCIGTKGQGADDILDETNGFTVTYGDIDELAERMKSLYEQRDHYDKHVLREGCVARFGKEAVCKQLESVYKNVTE